MNDILSGFVIEPQNFVSIVIPYAEEASTRNMAYASKQRVYAELASYFDTSVQLLKQRQKEIFG